MNDIFDEDLQPVTPVRKRTISITSEPVTAILVKIDGGKRLYTSKKAARRTVAWRVLYETGRIGDDNGGVGWMRLHQRIVRWLAKGYIAPESGLKDDSND